MSRGLKMGKGSRVSVFIRLELFEDYVEHLGKCSNAIESGNVKVEPGTEKIGVIRYLSSSCGYN